MKLFGNPRRLCADVPEKCHGKPRHATKQNLTFFMGFSLAELYESYLTYCYHEL